MTTSIRIKPHHLSRQAIIYVRQSTTHQAIHNQESLRLQYALRERAVGLGWPADQIVVIDSDLGMSGSTSQGRLGFQDLVSRVSLNQAGSIFAFDVTRLARNCSDWYQLLDLCGMRQCLIGDGDSVYDPSQIDGRLLLGLKGQISELELHTIRSRLNAGMMNKAKRGELIIDLPVGYIKSDIGTTQKHPDREVQSRVELVFERFLALNSLGKVVRFLNENELLMPRRICGGAEVRWRAPTKSSVSSLLRNPTYAGAYAYGKTCFVPQKSASHKRYKQRIGQDQWKVLIKDRHPAYVTWDQFMAIQKILENNLMRYNSHAASGTPRAGAALLQGIVHCGRCGHQMTIQYRQGGQYRCNYLYQQRCQPVCLTARSTPVDDVVANAVLEAVTATEFDLFEQSLQELNKRQQALDKAKSQELERLRYDAQRAEKQYQLCDPENRLVASELESRWEKALATYREAGQKNSDPDKFPKHPMSPKIVQQWRTAGASLPALWSDNRLDNSQRKRVIRALVNKVVLTIPEPGKLEIRIVWKSEKSTSKTIDVKVGSLSVLRKGDELQKMIVDMAKTGLPDEWIAFTLSRDGYRGCDRFYVGLNVVARLRCEGGVKRSSTRSTDTFHGCGLTLAQLARKMNVKCNWIFEQIVLGKIEWEPDPTHKRFFAPADSVIIETLESLAKAEQEACSEREAA